MQAQLPGDIRVHDLRHGMATQWLSAGINPNVITERLGHFDVGFTLRVYGQALPHDESRLVGPMEEAILRPVPESLDRPRLRRNGLQTGRRNSQKRHH